MAKLPVYVSRSNIAIAPMVRVDNSGAQALTKAASNLGKAMQETAARWQDIKNEEESLAGKNQATAEFDSILEEAENYSGWGTHKELEDKERELLDRMGRTVDNISLGFTNDPNRVDFQNRMAMTTMANQERLKQIFRNKYIDENKSERLISLERNKKNFVNTGNAIYKQNYLADLQSSFEAGYMTKAEYTQQKLNVDGWDKYAAVNAVMQDPEGYLQKIKDGKLKADAETMSAIHSALEKKQKLEKYLQEVEDYNTRQQIDSQLDELELPEALSLLDASQSAYGDKLYKAKRKALLSANGIDATTQADEHAKLLLEIDSMPKEQGEIEYFNAAKNIEAEIENSFANGKLSLESRKRLKNKLSTERGKNIELLKASDDGEKFKFWGFSYKDANDYIKENYSGGNGNNILLDYFDIVSDKNKEISTDEKMSILQGLIDKQMNDNFKAVSNRPRVGAVVDGYRFKGGDVHDEKNWEKI